MSARLAPNVVATFLGQTAIFRGCSPAMLSQLAPHLDQQAFAAGETLLAAGSTPPGIMLLQAGRASLRLGAPGSPGAIVDEMSSGDCFGETAILMGGASQHSVIAEEAGVALTVRKEHFDQILAAVPAVGHALAKRVAARFVRAGAASARAAVPTVQPVPSREATPSGFTRAVPAGGLDSGGVAPGATLQKGEVRFCEVSSFQVTPQVLEMLPSRMIQQQRVFPLELRGKTLVVGMVNPFALESRQELRRYLHNADPEIVGISQDDWAQALLRFKVGLAGERGGGAAAAGAGAAASRIAYQAESKKEQEKQQIIIGDEVISLLDRILIEALDRGASDVHIEPETASVRVRYRVQGLMVDRKELVPISFALPLVARIKVLAELDITERRLPQEGRIVGFLGRRELSFRVATMPTSRGEKAVVRVLDAADVMRPFNQIFLDGQVADAVYQAIAGSHGAILVAGPSASGKSTTLYSMLNQRKLLRPDNNIVTVEDPVEYPFPGLTQVSVNTKAGLDYPAVMRALLRQDPDVLVVGELRDPASAALALEAALTGHLVLSTLHGSSALAVLQRLEQFGASNTLLSQAINLILVQRLARRLCPSCAREEEVAPALLENLVSRGLVPRGGSIRLPRAVGCELCDKSGYLGRAAVVELLSFQHEELRAALVGGMPLPDVVQKATALNCYVSLVRSAKLLMARKILAPADALLAVSA